jgi:hypothetical protein
MDIQLLLWVPLLETWVESYFRRIEAQISLQNQTSEIIELAGCDFLTISPGLLEELKNKDIKLERKLSVEKAKAEETIPKVSYLNNEGDFKWALLVSPRISTLHILWLKRYSNEPGGANGFR